MWKIKLIFSIVFPALDVECRWCINMVLGKSVFFQRGNKIASVWFLWHFKVCWLFPQLWRLTEQRKILQLLCKDASLFFFFLHTDYLLSVCASVKMWQMKYRKFSHSGQHGLYSPQGWTRLVLSNSSYFYSICVEVLLLLFCCEWKLKTSFITVEDLCVPIPQYIHIIYRMHQMLIDIHQQDLWKSNKDETKDLILYFFHKIKTSFRFQSLNPKANRIDDSLSEYHARNNVARLFQEKLNYVHLKRLEPSIVCTINYICELISHRNCCNKQIRFFLQT